LVLVFRWSAPQRTEEKRELTDLEKAAAERDAKRRRATYRNKVHTNRKTQTEVRYRIETLRIGFITYVIHR